MKIAYETWNPRGESRAVIEKANEICEDYAARGYDLTLRQLYYVFVSRALIPNNQKSYNRLGDLVNKARLSGLLDWDYIVDRTRNMRQRQHWESPQQIVNAAESSYHVDMWEKSSTRVEVWVEKEALAGVVSGVADQYDCPWFSCRGYVSQSEMWQASRRFLRYLNAGQNVVVLHLGDHDPSGIDMTRDIRDRATKFTLSDWMRERERERDDDRDASGAYYELTESLDFKTPIEVRRIALNMDQVRQYDCPPNFAKITDSRARDYVDRYGTDSWELDALDPSVIESLIAGQIEGQRSETVWNEAVERKETGRKRIKRLSLML